jgi:Ca2+-binding EF-hand superfamily protein
MLVMHTLKQKQKKRFILFLAQYGLRSSGLCQHQHFADVLRSMGFNPSKADADLWMRESNGIYEYIAVYVDNLLIAARDPNEIIVALSE